MVGGGDGDGLGVTVAVGAGVNVGVGAAVGEAGGARRGDSGISMSSGAPGIVTSARSSEPAGTSKTRWIETVSPPSASIGSPSSIDSLMETGIGSPSPARTANHVASMAARVSCRRVSRASTTRYSPSGSYTAPLKGGPRVSCRVTSTMSSSHWVSLAMSSGSGSGMANSPGAVECDVRVSPVASAGMSKRYLLKWVTPGSATPLRDSGGSGKSSR